MKIIYNFSLAVSFLILCSGCSEDAYQNVVIIHNDLDLYRISETVSIPKSELGDISQEKFLNLILTNEDSDTVLNSQFIDGDMDGVKDMIVFQPELEPLSSKKYLLQLRNNSINEMPGDMIAYSRFVPERIGDYAWENDRVAFRTYGPEAEDLVARGLSGGTLSSGIDCWLKRVEYPVIDKWYKKHTEQQGSYHEDTGEGLDNYHVGSSRGCGGIGVWMNDSLYVSRNFTDYSSITNGPVRTAFELIYAPWNAGGISISEQKHISLDAGSNLTRFEISFNQNIDSLVTGLALPEPRGEIVTDEKAGWFYHWGPHHNSELGIAIVLDPKYLSGYQKHNVDAADESHLFVQLQTINNKVVYYAGFTWKQSGQYQDSQQWQEYLVEFTQKLRAPLRVEIEN